MDKREFAVFASALKTYYPREQLLPNEQSMALWYAQLKDIPYKVAEVVLHKWVATNKWSPSIADIREQATALVTEETPDWSEGWNEVLRAISRHGMYNIPEALNSLSGLTRECVERLGFRNLCLSENPTADRANFRIMYERLYQRKKTDETLPPALKELIEDMKTGGNLLEGKKAPELGE